MHLIPIYEHVYENHRAVGLATHTLSPKLSDLLFQNSRLVCRCWTLCVGSFVRRLYVTSFEICYDRFSRAGSLLWTGAESLLCYCCFSGLPVFAFGFSIYTLYLSDPSVVIVNARELRNFRELKENFLLQQCYTLSMFIGTSRLNLSV